VILVKVLGGLGNFLEEISDIGQNYFLLIYVELKILNKEWNITKWIQWM